MKYWSVMLNGEPWLDRMGECTGFLERLRGYMGRPSPGVEALWFPDQPSLHTCFMKFELDVVFLDGRHRVVGVMTDVGPRRWIHEREAVGAIEIPARTRPRPVCGDVLEFRACA